MNTAREIVQEIIGAGGELWPDGDRVRGRNIPRRLAALVKADEGAILAALLSVPAPEGYEDATQPPAARPGTSTGQQTASVTCGGCQHFIPDEIHPAEGLGRCSVTSNGLPPPGGRGYGCCLPGAPRSCPEFLGVAS